MPNHITSQVRIGGSKKATAKLVKDSKLIQDGDVERNEFDFNAVIKMPPELLITSGSNVDLGMAAYNQAHYDKEAKYSWWAERYPNVTGPETLKKHLEASDNDMDKQALVEGKQALDNLRKHGYKDWYDWSNAQWGTKWNAYDVHYIDGGDDFIAIQLDTAWDTPQGIWSALRDKGFTVDGFYYGEMEGYEEIGDKAWDYFSAYQNVEVEYNG